MKIIHFVNSLGCGGAEKLVIDLAHEMQMRDHQVLIISLSDKIEYIEKINEYKLEVINCGFSGTIYNIHGIMRTFMIIKRVVRRFKPDVLHSHIFLSDLFARLNKPAYARVVTTLHRDEPWWTDRNFKSRIKRYLESVTAKKLTDRFIAVSAIAKKVAIDKLKVDKKKVSVIMNGVDINSFSKGERSINPFPIIIQVARFYPEKAHQLSLMAFKDILDIYPNAELWLVGDGPLRKSIESLGGVLEIKDQVRFLGIRQDIPDLLHKADVFLLSSEREGLPISILEAMAAKTPIVTTTVGEIPRVLEDEISGLLFKSGDVESLTRQLIRCLQDKTLSEQLVKNAYQLVRSKYSIGATTDAYLKEYERAIRHT